MRRHELDVVSLLGGLLFVAIGVVYLVDGLTAVDLNARLVGAAVLLMLGLIGLTSGVRRGLQSSDS
jgi:hypothetical protein